MFLQKAHSVSSKQTFFLNIFGDSVRYAHVWRALKQNISVIHADKSIELMTKHRTLNAMSTYFKTS